MHRLNEIEVVTQKMLESPLPAVEELCTTHILIEHVEWGVGKSFANGIGETQHCTGLVENMLRLLEGDYANTLIQINTIQLR